jgi:hypothetical protein
MPRQNVLRSLGIEGSLPIFVADFQEFQRLMSSFVINAHFQGTYGQTNGRPVVFHQLTGVWFDIQAPHAELL